MALPGEQLYLDGCKRMVHFLGAFLKDSNPDAQVLFRMVADCVVSLRKEEPELAARVAQCLLDAEDFHDVEKCTGLQESAPAGSKGPW